MKKLIFLLLLLTASLSALAAPGDTFTLNTVGTQSGGPAATSVELHRNCRGTSTLIEVVDVASLPKTYAGELDADGDYSFCVYGRNANGLGAVSNIIDIAVGTPGSFVIPPGGSVDVQCVGPCSVTINSQ